MKNRPGALALVILSLVAGFATVGCGRGGKARDADVVSYPKWPFQKYERLAVLPFQVSRRDAAGAADRLTAALVDDLSRNGAFKVMDRSSMKEVFTEQDLSNLADVSDPRTAIPQGRIEAAQALVIGRITTFDLVAERRPVRRPIYGRDSRGRRVISGYEERLEYRHAATVAATVRVIDAETGSLLFSHASQPVTLDESGHGRPPEESPEQLADEAVTALARQFYQQIAPTRQRVEFDTNMLLVALDYYDGRYEEARALPSNLDKFLVAVRGLPRSCDHNRFRVAITADGGRDDLFSTEFTWSARDGQSGQAWPVDMTAIARGGAGKYVVKLYSVGAPQPVLTRPFEIRAPKEGEEAPVEETRDRQESEY
ncbi:MAG: hypothetical protein JNG88_16545 [Phycisphaerales bacterium]|nr:hypothetical protein [Phycisphaerales bacterium]